MQAPNMFYQQELKTHQTRVKQLSKKIAILSTLRLSVFIITAIAIYFTFSMWQVAAIIAVVGIVLFIILLNKHTRLKNQRNLHKALVKINTDEIKIASGDFHDRDDGLQFQNPTHFYSLDIDLFGKGSFFQFINRTSIDEGAQNLAKSLTENNTKNIESRQKAIQELAELPKWRQKFSATASLIKVETKASDIIEWLADYKTFSNSYIKWLPLAFTICSITIAALGVLEIIGISFIGYWLLVGLAITGRFIKPINNLAGNTDKIKDTFRQYALLLDQIEQQEFSSQLLKIQQEKIKAESKKASVIFKEFSKSLDALDNRNNLISAIFGNGLFLSDLKNSYKVEQWVIQYGNKVAHWFEVVSFFDAYNSLGNYAFNNPDYNYPTITTDKITIDAKNLGHPLLDAKKRVNSDVVIDAQQFCIVTGANMAGKSTFLRTISLHIVMANVGLPVCATSSKYNPVKLITSMRTSDSLTDDSSYFFSELTRLKFIVDEVQKESYFIILDEILKGTNSTDKAIGSKKFVEKLVATHATGIIATHDLSLCTIEDELSEVKNYFFDAQIIDNELHFDYKFKVGVCQNMNASFLLKKMEIID
ncbi:MutS-related protein [Lacinutrix undariae]